MNDPDLKPCPFCGAKQDYILDNPIGPYLSLFYSHGDTEPTENDWSVECNFCDVETAMGTKEQVIRHWNKRA